MYWQVLAFSLILLVGAGVWAAGREIVINLPMFTYLSMRTGSSCGLTPSQ